MSNFDRDIGFLVLTLRQTYLSALEQELKRTGVTGFTPLMTRLIPALQTGEPVSVGDIANGSGLDKSTAALLLTKMYDEEMVEKTRDEKDKRVVWVTLTDKGTSEVTKAKQAVSTVSKTALSGVTPEEQASVKRGLYKILGNLTED